MRKRPFEVTHWPFLLSILQETWYWHENVNANRVAMSGVKCSGTELSLAHCRHDEDVACPQGGMHYGAGVACSESERSWGRRPSSLPGCGRRHWLFLARLWGSLP